MNGDGGELVGEGVGTADEGLGIRGLFIGDLIGCGGQAAVGIEPGVDHGLQEDWVGGEDGVVGGGDSDDAPLALIVLAFLDGGLAGAQPGIEEGDEDGLVGIVAVAIVSDGDGAGSGSQRAQVDGGDNGVVGGVYDHEVVGRRVGDVEPRSVRGKGDRRGLSPDTVGPEKLPGGQIDNGDGTVLRIGDVGNGLEGVDGDAGGIGADEDLADSVGAWATGEEDGDGVDFGIDVDEKNIISAQRNRGRLRGSWETGALRDGMKGAARRPGAARDPTGEDQKRCQQEHADRGLPHVLSEPMVAFDSGSWRLCGDHELVL